MFGRRSTEEGRDTRPPAKHSTLALLSCVLAAIQCWLSRCFFELSAEWGCAHALLLLSETRFCTCAGGKGALNLHLNRNPLGLTVNALSMAQFNSSPFLHMYVSNH